MNTRFSSLLLGTVAVLSAPAFADELWYADYDAAVVTAKAQGKDLLVDFTGSDWCGWCIRLHEEVFDHEEFLVAAQKDYVLVALDFPNGDEAKAKVPNPERNEELKNKYEIRGFPTILLMTADGEVYGQTGYQEGGPEAYLKHLAELRESGRTALIATKKLVAEFGAAEGKAKVVLWEQAMALMATQADGSPFTGQLAGLVRWALEHDAKNEAGLKLRAVEALLAAGQGDDDLIEAATELDPKNEKGLLDHVVQAVFTKVQDEETAKAALVALDAHNELGFKNKEIGFDLNFMATLWSDGPLQSPEGVQKYGQLAKAIGSDDEARMEHLEGLLGG